MKTEYNYKNKVRRTVKQITKELLYNWIVKTYYFEKLN